MIAHTAGNVSIKEQVKKWCVLLSGKSLTENRNCQPSYDALQKPKHQPKSVWNDLRIVKKISEFKAFKVEWCTQLFQWEQKH